MKHLIVDDAMRLLPNWQEAFPEVGVVSRQQAMHDEPQANAMYWLRLGVEEFPAQVISSLRQPGKLVVLADEPREVNVLESLTAGALGCCNTHAAPEVLRQVEIVVGNGGLWVGQSLLQQVLVSTSRVLESKARDLPGEDWKSLLSEREVGVARLVAAGESNKEIAAELAITERTVKAHLTAIFDKLQVRDRLQLSLRVNGLKL